MVILMCLTCLNLIWNKSCDIKHIFLISWFLQFCKKNPENLWLINGHLGTISGHFLANYMKIFHKKEIQTVILRCLVGLNLNWIKNCDIILVKVIFYHAWKCIISWLICQSEFWHLLRKPALIFLNHYVPTPNIPDFKGLIMRNLRNDIKKLPKSCIKGTRTHSIWFEFHCIRR